MIEKTTYEKSSIKFTEFLAEIKNLNKLNRRKGNK